MRVLVTGATGFVGRAVVRGLAVAGFDTIAAVRRDVSLGAGIETRRIGDLAEHDAWSGALDGVDSVVHLAARVHVMRETAADPAGAFLADNCQGTRRLAVAAARAGVQRLVFLSSIKVNGEATPNKPFDEDDAPAPEDAYGVSKWCAEQALAEVAAGQAIETVILRTPLVYGPGVGANFLSLLRLCDSRLPLPLGAVDGNARSLIFLDNLVDAIRCALTHSAAAGRTYLVRDGEDLSTAGLVRRLRHALGRSSCMVPAPPAMLLLAARALGKSAAAARLLGSLSVDDRRIRHELGWRPPFTADQGFAATAAWYRTRGVAAQ